MAFSTLSTETYSEPSMVRFMVHAADAVQKSDGAVMALAIPDLDRLVSRTELSPPTKRALKEVRRAVITGVATDADQNKAEWRVGITSSGGSVVHFSFSFKKVD